MDANFHGSNGLVNMTSFSRNISVLVMQPSSTVTTPVATSAGVNVTAAPGDEYDYRGATVFCVVVIVLYSFSLGAMVVTHIRKHSRSNDPSIDQYLKSIPAIATEAERENRRRLRDVFILPHFMRNFQLPEEMDSEVEERDSDGRAENDEGADEALHLVTRDARNALYANNNKIAIKANDTAATEKKTKGKSSSSVYVSMEKANNNGHGSDFTAPQRDDGDGNSYLLENQPDSENHRHDSRHTAKTKQEKRGYCSRVGHSPHIDCHKLAEQRSPRGKGHLDESLSFRDASDNRDKFSDSDRESDDRTVSELACPSYEDVLKHMSSDQTITTV